MSSLMVDDANFKSERAVVEEELRQRVLADPYGRFQALAIPENSFAVHPTSAPASARSPIWTPPASPTWSPSTPPTTAPTTPC